MATTAITRLAIVGASSLAGKELNDVLAESPLAASRITLLDEEGVAGQIAAAGDDISVVQKVDADSFDGEDFVFFAGSVEETLRYWRAARQAGAGIVDLTGALEPEPDDSRGCQRASGDDGAAGCRRAVAREGRAAVVGRNCF